jgi:hypothetical protein
MRLGVGPGFGAGAGERADALLILGKFGGSAGKDHPAVVLDLLITSGVSSFRGVFLRLLDGGTP